MWNSFKAEQNHWVMATSKESTSETTYKEHRNLCTNCNTVLLTHNTQLSTIWCSLLLVRSHWHQPLFKWMVKGFLVFWRTLKHYSLIFPWHGFLKKTLKTFQKWISRYFLNREKLKILIFFIFYALGLLWESMVEKNFDF